MTDAIEEEFDASWDRWLDEADKWGAFFEQVAQAHSPAVDELLRELRLVSDAEISVAAKLKRSAEGKAISIPGPFSDRRQLANLLALGFMHSEPVSLAVPRQRAKARGVRFGRKLKLTPHQRREALARREAGEALTDIGRTFGVSHSTISRLTQGRA